MKKLILRTSYGKNTSFVQVSEDAAKEDYIKSLRWGSDDYVSDEDANKSFDSQLINTSWFKTESFSYIIIDLDAVYEEKACEEKDTIVIDYDDALMFY